MWACIESFGEGSRKLGLAMDWMLSRNEGDSIVGTLMLFCQKVSVMKPGHCWDWQRSAVTCASQQRGLLVTVRFGPGSWDELQAGIKNAGRNINNLRYADDMTLLAESEQELKSLLMRVTEESEKAGLKLNFQKMKIMASGPITSWQVDGGKLETMTDFIFLGSKVIMDGDCSLEIQRHLLL